MREGETRKECGRVEEEKGEARRCRGRDWGDEKGACVVGAADPDGDARATRGNDGDW